MKKVFFISLLTVWTILAWAQNYPKPILPGQELTIASKNDTLWIITDSQLEKTIITAKKLKNADLQIVNYQKQIELLNEQLQQSDTLLLQAQKTLKFYQQNWQECKGNTLVLINENKMLNAKLKVIQIVGVVTTIAAFVLGAYLL